MTVTEAQAVNVIIRHVYQKQRLGQLPTEEEVRGACRDLAKNADKVLMAGVTPDQIDQWAAEVASRREGPLE